MAADMVYAYWVPEVHGKQHSIIMNYYNCSYTIQCREKGSLAFGEVVRGSTNEKYLKNPAFENSVPVNACLECKESQFGH